MKHFKNHRKDRFVQQCSGYGGSGESHRLSDTQLDRLALDSFKSVVTKAQEMEFPIYVAESGGYWHVTASVHLFATEIVSFEDLLDFGVDMVVGFSKEEFLPKSVDARLQAAFERSALSDVKKSTTDIDFERE